MVIASNLFKSTANVAAESSTLLRWLDYVPIVPLVVAATLLGVSPSPFEPHLWQKLKLLAAGRIEQPLDMLDLFFHGMLLPIVALKLVRLRQLTRIPRS
jgi:hypothetical protein